MNKQRLICTVVAIVAMALAGCGGGGSGGGPMDLDGGGGSGNGGGGSMPGPSMMGGIPAAARNQPLAGKSVTQSSIGAAGVTTDNISVDVAYGTNGLASYTVANGDNWSLSSEDTETDTRINEQAPIPGSGLTFFAVGAVKQGLSPEDPETALVLLTDIESDSDTDYLVWGSWNIAPNVVSGHLPSIDGAFATGSDPFTQGNLPALTGTATYRGYAMGQYFEPDSPGQSWSAMAELTADFGDGNGLGTISGSIDQFRFSRGMSGEEVASPMTKVALGQTFVGSAKSGFFQGTTTGTFDDGTELSGRWGGRFFGNNEPDGIPGSVAGTFGAVSDDDTRGLIGAFGAPKQ